MSNYEEMNLLFYKRT